LYDLERNGEVFVLHMRNGENRFNPTSISALNERLDEVDKADGPKALVSIGEGKFYSNGLDLDWMTGEGSGEVPEFLETVLALFGRILTAPYITLAAVNGHAFAGGGMLALAHDFRVMRSDRGYFCLPEVDLRMPLHPGMSSLIQARLSHSTAHEAIATGRRYAAAEALEAGIVDDSASEEEVLQRALERARPLAAKAHPVLAELKAGMYGPVLKDLAKAVSFSGLSANR